MQCNALHLSIYRSISDRCQAVPVSIDAHEAFRGATGVNAQILLHGCICEEPTLILRGTLHDGAFRSRFWISIVEFCCAKKVFEWNSLEVAGDYGLTNWFPSDEEGQKKMRLAELKNGRLAMLAFAGAVTQAALHSLAWTLSKWHGNSSPSEKMKVERLNDGIPSFLAFFKCDVVAFGGSWKVKIPNIIARVSFDVPVGLAAAAAAGLVVRGEQQLRICVAPRQLQQAQHFVLLNFVSQPTPTATSESVESRPSYQAAVPPVQLLAARRDLAVAYEDSGIDLLDNGKFAQGLVGAEGAWGRFEFADAVDALMCGGVAKAQKVSVDARTSYVQPNALQ
ncbi:PUS7 [Symbiodinium sp. KB8]|nr:PUS7 [Symbiodinium sp. KB8]